MAARRPLPGFLIVGAQKSATRWMRTALGEHPDVYSATRELEFFNHNFDKGLKWYLQQFDGWNGEEIVGEATPGYMFWRERPGIQAARIRGLIPRVRLIAILRNPMDRARSAFIHHIRRGRIDPSADLIEWVETVDPEKDKLGIISGGWYAASLEPYRRRFGAGLRVFLHDDVESDPVGVYRQACAHVGVPGGFLPPSIHERRNRGEEALAADNPRARVLDEDAGFRSTLYPQFETDIRKLESMFELDLSLWRSTADLNG